MNSCYYCDDPVDRAPYTGKQTICSTCRQKLEEQAKQEHGLKEQKKQDLRNYWLSPKKEQS